MSLPNFPCQLERKRKRGIKMRFLAQLYITSSQIDTYVVREYEKGFNNFFSA